MIAQRRGTIINVGSVVTSRTLTGSAAYTASKYGLLGFSRVLAEEMRAHGVRVGVLSAGATDTPLWDAMPAAPARERMLRPDQVAEAALLMATLDPNATLEELTLLPAGASCEPSARAPGRPSDPSAIMSPSLTPRACGDTQGGTNDHVDRDGRQEDLGPAARRGQARVGPPDPPRRRRLLRHVLRARLGRYRRPTTTTSSSRNGVKVFVDRHSAPYLQGSEIDYVDNNMLGAGFAIKNPNVKSSCGCGSSHQF